MPSAMAGAAPSLRPTSTSPPEMMRKKSKNSSIPRETLSSANSLGIDHDETSSALSILSTSVIFDSLS